MFLCGADRACDGYRDLPPSGFAWRHLPPRAAVHGAVVPPDDRVESAGFVMSPVSALTAVYGG